MCLCLNYVLCVMFIDVMFFLCLCVMFKMLYSMCYVLCYVFLCVMFKILRVSGASNNYIYTFTRSAERAEVQHLLTESETHNNLQSLSSPYICV